MWTAVEKCFLDESELPYSFEGEMIRTIQVTNIYELGKLISLRFLEWVLDNPTGVVALPTGRTPEYFIKTLERYKRHWRDEEVQSEVKEFGLSYTDQFPDTSALKFVMLDEFFPMKASHRNSFCRYIRSYYLSLLGISDENVLTFDFVREGVMTEKEMDLFDFTEVNLELLSKNSLNGKELEQKVVLEKVVRYCQHYEQKIQQMGGIGFFLGGIGPGAVFNGHVY